MSQMDHEGFVTNPFWNGDIDPAECERLDLPPTTSFVEIFGEDDDDEPRVESILCYQKWQDKEPLSELRPDEMSPALWEWANEMLREVCP